MKHRILETTWRSYEIQMLPVTATDAQRKVVRMAYYTGAASLFAALMNQLAPGTEATEPDLGLMEDIHAELQEFAAEVRRLRGDT